VGAVAATFWLLLIAHAVTDYPLQGRFVAEYKSPDAPPVHGERIWVWVMSAHALVNAGGVYLVTGSLRLSLAEAVLHWIIDYGKARHAYAFHADQGLHVATKLGLAAAAAWGAA
jgi:hypothetical protein